MIWKRFINQLAQSSNPYLKGHASNPIHWQLWSQKAIELAKTQNKPIFLSIGYHSCHWCHVMNKESFSHQAIADKLNEHFVAIKIDKEEWPDLDSIYMMYLQATSGSGGWPLNVFLTPQLQPIFGGTYWAGPNVGTQQLETLNAVPFERVLVAVNKQWTENQKECIEHAQDISLKLASLVDSKTAEPVDLTGAILESANRTLATSGDEELGGYGQAPKFPLPATLGYAITSKDNRVRAQALKTLMAIYRGGIKDQLGHGIARYSVTADWHLPHFEKMLGDQALLLLVALQDPATYELAEDLTDFLVKGPLRTAAGGWYSAIDADSPASDGRSVEGEFYVWTYLDFMTALKDLKMLDRDVCAEYFGVNEEGNVNADLDPHGEFTGKNILSAYKTVEQVAQTFGRKPQQIKHIIADGKQKLLAFRTENKTPPNTDEKIVTGWNGIAIGALARASWVLGRRDALTAAVEGINAIHSENWNGTDLCRVSPGVPAVNDDYAYLISGLIELYQATFDPSHLKWALELQEQQLAKFWDPRGGFFTSQQWPWLLFRPKTTFDSAEPSSNGISLQNLLRLGSMTGNVEYIHKCQHLLDSFSADIAAQPVGYLSMLPSIERLQDPHCIAIIGDDDQTAAALLDEARAKASSEQCPLVRINKNSVHLFGDKAWSESEKTRIVRLDAY